MTTPETPFETLSKLIRPVAPEEAMAWVMARYGVRSDRALGKGDDLLDSQVASDGGQGLATGQVDPMTTPGTEFENLSRLITPVAPDEAMARVMVGHGVHSDGGWGKEDDGLLDAQLATHGLHGIAPGQVADSATVAAQTSSKVRDPLA